MAKYFETADFVLAATIIATTGVQPVRVEGSPGQARYLFDETQELQALTEAFRAGNVRVEPMVFCLAQRYLQDRLGEAAGPHEDSPTGILF